jgi:rhodanese-related sulfurtransferase
MNANISPAELKSLQSAGCCLVDVREPVEHAEAHVAGAMLIPLGELGRRSGEIDRSGPVVLMCQGGKRGGQALAKLEALGFAGLRNLEGGIMAWQAAGLPVERAAKQVFPLMRQVQIVIGTGVLGGVLLSQAVHPGFIWLSAFFGAGLIFAGSTGWCGLAILLSKLPWNKVSKSCCAGH